MASSQCTEYLFIILISCALNNDPDVDKLMDKPTFIGLILGKILDKILPQLVVWILINIIL